MADGLDFASHPSERERRASMVRNGALAVAGATAMLALARFAADGFGSEVGWLLAGTAVAMVSVRIVLALTGSLSVSSLLIPLIGTAALTGMALLDKGLHSEALFWAPTVPLIAAVVCGPRHALAFGALQSALWLALAAATAGPSSEAWLHALGGVGAVLFIAYIGWAYETNRIASQRELWSLAHQSLVTELPNRAMFNRSLADAVARARRIGHTVGLLFIDLDGLKRANDRHGHEAGDALLRETGRRLLSVTREEESPYHLSGDEFTVIIDCRYDLRAAEVVAERILEATRTPVQFRDRSISWSASIGIAGIRDHGSSEDLLKRADAAMYLAKQKGGNCYAILDDEDLPDRPNTAEVRKHGKLRALADSVGDAEPVAQREKR